MESFFALGVSYVVRKKKPVGAKSYSCAERLAGRGLQLQIWIIFDASGSSHGSVRLFGSTPKRDSMSVNEL